MNEPLTAKQLVQRGLLRAALALAADDLVNAGLSPVFDIDTDTGCQRLVDLLADIGWLVEALQETVEEEGAGRIVPAAKTSAPQTGSAVDSAKSPTSTSPAPDAAPE